MAEANISGRLGRYLAWALACVAGVVWAMAFPKAHVSLFGWAAPALLLLASLPFGAPTAAADGRWQRAFRRGVFQLGYVAGLAHYLTSLYWLLFIPFPAGAIAGWLALSAYLALYPALWVWLCWRALPVEADVPALVGGTPVREYSIFLARLGAASTFQRIRWALFCAVLWVALEMAVARMLTGFPWNLLGASQYENLPLIQISSVTGVYGVSFLLVWTSTALLCAGAAALHNSRRRRELEPILSPFPRMGDFILPLLVVCVALLFGFRRATQPISAGPDLKLALVQPSIPQTLIWDRSQNATRFEQLIALSEKAIETKPDILVWPEAAVPELLRVDPATARRVRELANAHGVYMILGADDAAPKFPEARTFRDYNFYNSSFAINPQGEISGMYRKRRLVMFGEYVPLARYFPFLKRITPVGEGGFTAGTEPVPFKLADLNARVSVLICFEDVFPHLAREYVDGTMDFLLNPTNNGWFGESAAQWQHAANAVFRAVENGIPLVRCANNGLTCWVDSVGRMHNVHFENTDNIYGAGFKVVTVPMLPPGDQRTLTYYTRHGDVFGWTCVALAAWSSIISSVRRKRPAPR